MVAAAAFARGIFNLTHTGIAAELSIDGAFEGGRKIVLPYSKIEFTPEYEIGGAKHYRDNTYASVAIAQVQDQEWKTVWPFEFASSKIQEVTLG